MEIRRLLGLAAASLAAVVAFAQSHLVDLKCEGLTNPLGIDNVEPHFSWKVVSAKPQAQEFYELEVATDSVLLLNGKADLWRSGKVKSGESVMVSYAGNPLHSRQLCYWRVRSFGKDADTGWSSVQRFSVGIVGEDRLHGRYVGLPLGQANSVLLNRTFNLSGSKMGKTAFLHVNSLGYHEAYINGRRVSDGVLAPAVSQLDKRSLIVTYDVTSLLQKGSNTLTLWIGSGWYKKDTFEAAHEGALVCADLDLLAGGTWQTLLSTDEAWKGMDGGYADPGSWKPHGFAGEIMDARQFPVDLMPETLKPMPWNVQVVQVNNVVASPQMCQKNVIKETLVPARVENLGDGRWLVDMGKVINGLFEVKLPCLPEGHQVRVRYADHLNDNGEAEMPAREEDLYIASGRSQGDHFINRFNHHCFRFAVVENLPVRLDATDIRAHRIGIDASTIGTFLCSDADLNSIHNMVSYTMDNLAFAGYMVDCAHIERLGYGGDGNASTLSLQNVYDMAPTYANWLQAWNDAIQPDGGLPHTAPNPYVAGGGAYWCSFMVQAPFRTWRNYGDDRMLHRCYDNMRLWLRYVDAHSREGLLYKWPDTDYRYWYLGDWLAPSGIDVTKEESINLVNNCALSQSYAELIQMATYLGRDADVKEYTLRRDALNKRIHKMFYHAETGTYGTASQLDMVYPLLVGAVPQELQSSVREKLLTMRDHIGVGLVGVPVLTEWATLEGECDFMYRMLKQEDYPGYLYMIRNGATGTWEAWDKPNARSHFHNCFNGIDSWFFQALGGIVPTSAGYRTTLISPQAPKGLDWVRVTRETPYGTILVHWKRASESAVDVHVVIPNGISATIDGKTVGAGTYDFRIL